MIRPRRDGFIFVLAAVSISLVGAAIIILAATSRAMMDQSNRALVEAHGYNLAASAAAWASRNGSTSGRTDLDVASLEVPNGQASVELALLDDGKVSAAVSIACRRGDIAVRRKITRTLPRR